MRIGKKRVLGIVGIAATAMLALSACSGGSTDGSKSDGGATTLTFLTFETPNLTAQYWDDAIARASAEVPGVKIKKLVAPNNQADYLRQLYSSGQAPDIMSSFAPDGFAQAGQLSPWSEEDLKNFQFPTAGAIDGKVYALPTNTQAVPLVYYNKDQFAKAGITAPPTTYPEFLAVCAKLKAAGFTPIEIGGGGQDTWAASFPLEAAVEADVLTKTPDWFTKRAAGEVKFSDDDFQAATAKISALSAAGYLDKGGLSRSYADTEQAFRDGKGTMYPMGSWFAASVDTKAAPFEVGVFGWPSDNGPGVIGTATGGGLSVNSKAKDVALAKKWALAFTLNKENLDASVKADANIIAVKGYELPSGLGDAYVATATLVKEAADAGTAVPAWLNVTGDGAMIPGFADKFYPANVDLVSGRLSSKAFTKVLDAEWERAAR